MTSSNSCAFEWSSARDGRMPRQGRRRRSLLSVGNIYGGRLASIVNVRGRSRQWKGARHFNWLCARRVVCRKPFFARMVCFGRAGWLFQQYLEEEFTIA